MRSGDAEPAVSASAVSAAGVGVQCGRRAAACARCRRAAGRRRRRRCGRAVGRAAGAERADRRQRAGRQRRRLGLGQQGVGRRRAADGLAGVVDEDVERPAGGDLVGERDDLRGVAQVDADDPQALQPVLAVGHRGEAARGVARKARRDRRVGAVAQQPQRDVHADLRAPAGEQRAAPAQVGARIAASVVAGRARRTELVVEGVDLDVALLADVARAWLQQRARERLAGAGAGAVAVCFFPFSFSFSRSVGAGRSGRPAVSSSMRSRAPVAVAAVTAPSAASTAARRCARRCCLTLLNSDAVARRTATASGCSGASACAAAMTRRQASRSARSMPSVAMGASLGPLPQPS